MTTEVEHKNFRSKKSNYFKIETTKSSKSVSFDSSIFLDDLFKKAIKYATEQSANSGNFKSRSIEISVGLDCYTYGVANAKLACLISKYDYSKAKEETFTEIINDHIGNLKILNSYNSDDIKFIDGFKKLIKISFQCFGKRWYELSDYDIGNSDSHKQFKIIKKDQSPHVLFENSTDEAELMFKVEQIISKFFESMLKCVCTDIFKKLKNVCIALPTDCHTYQKILLNECLKKIGIKDFFLTSKSIAIAMPLLAKNFNSSKKLVIDFGSGYMDCSILQMINSNCVQVLDNLADRSISSDDFFSACFRHLCKKLNINRKEKFAYTTLKSKLYQIMNDNKSLVNNAKYSPHLPRDIQETWLIKQDNKQIELNMRSLGAERLANSVIEKLKKTNLISKETSLIDAEIAEILICTDAVLFEYLEPLLYAYISKTKVKITFMDLDCPCLSASFLAYLNISTMNMLPFPIGMGLYTGVIKTLIGPKSNYPCAGKYLLQTILNKQSIVRVNLYEGFSILSRNCKHLCELKIENSLEKNGLCKIRLIIELGENGELKASAQDFEKNSELKLTIDYLPSVYLELVREENVRPVNISLRTDAFTLTNEKVLAKFLSDLDSYLDYLLNTYKYSPKKIQNELIEKVLLKKKFLSKNRLRLSLDDCTGIANDLEEFIKTNLPRDKNNKEMKTIQTYNNSEASSVVCSIL